MALHDIIVIGVSPSGVHLLIGPDGIRLGYGPRENMARPAVDPLFRSAALSFGPRVIGVVLSGDLNDGTAGLAAVKQCGGIAVVQDPGDALAPAMPRSALSQVTVDHCLPAAELGALLVRLPRLPAGKPSPVPADIRLEVAIAAGTGSSLDEIKKLGNPSPFTCPECNGVLSEMKGAVPLRFRCQVGHAYTADTLAHPKRCNRGSPSCCPADHSGTSRAGEAAGAGRACSRPAAIGFALRGPRRRLPQVLRNTPRRRGIHPRFAGRREP